MKGVILLAVLGIVVVFGLRRLERNMLYFPTKFPEGNWDLGQFSQYIEVCTFNTADGLTLHGWFAHALVEDDISEENPPYTILFCHGNAGNITHRLENVLLLAQLGLNVCIFDYRGYGKSEGRPNEQGVYNDAVAAYDYLLSREDVAKDKIVVFGRSLGGAVAVELATRKPCYKLILESTFSSVKDMTKTMFGALPVHYLVHTKFDSLSKIKRIQIPLLYIHGTDDAIVPFELGSRLFDAANEPKAFYAIQGADHNDTYEVGGREYFERIAQFIHTGF